MSLEIILKALADLLINKFMFFYKTREGKHMAVEDLVEHINKIGFGLIDEGVMTLEEMHNPPDPIRVSESKNKGIHHKIAKTIVVYKVSNSNFKNTQGKVNYISQKVDNLIHKKVKNLKIVKQKLKRKKS